MFVCIPGPFANNLCVRNMCQQQLKGWLIGACDGKSQDQVGIQCILFQFYPSCKLFCNSVKQGKGLTKALTCNRTFVLEFEDFLKTGGRVGGQPKFNKTFFLIASEWKIFFLSVVTMSIVLFIYLLPI